MKNNKRSAFTIVELVIVIAVIAILSAVLIPTFGAIIKDANIAADKTAASTLTSELHVYLKGKQIKNEADLLDALNKSGIGAKLTPSVEGIHFWYDMEAQMFVVKELKEVNPASRAVAPANTSFRDLYNKNLYLVDYYVLGELFSTADVAYDVFSYIDDLATAEQYANLITILSGVADNHAYKTIANDILAKVHNTTIRTEAGAFFSVEGNAAKNEYFSAGATFVGNGYFKYDGTNVTTTTAAPLPAGVVNIPAYIDHIVEDGLNYAETTATITISLNRVGILAPGFTNANVLIGEDTYRIYPETNEKEDELVNVNDATDIIPLVVKLPFEDIVISYEKKGVVNNVGDKIYVALRNETLQLNVANANDITQISNKVDRWELIDGDNNVLQIINESTGIITLANAEYIDNVCEFKVRAIAKDINGNVVTAEATIVVAKPLSAELTIITSDGHRVISFANGVTNNIDLTFNGELTSYETIVSATYSTDNEGSNVAEILSIAPVVSVDNEETSAFLSTSDGTKLIFKAPDNDGNGDPDEGSYTFSLKLDGCLGTSVTAEMEDATKAIFRTNHRHERSADRGYYIGSTNSVKLSDLFNVGDRFTTGLTATLSIYDRVGGTGKLYPIYLANNDPDEDEKYNLTTKINGDFADVIELTTDDWDDVVIEFIYEDENGNSAGDNTLDAYIEIIPSDGSVSTIIKFEVVDGGINVTDISGLTDLDTVTGTVKGDVILQKDIVTVASTDKIYLGDYTLYGNGYVINANQYVSVKGDDNKFPEDDYFITIKNGTIDNVYINGPVYPKLDYDTNATGYYVTGIMVTGDATIQHSYASGFRQPVKAAGSKLAIVNTTLRGGNYANLILDTGDLDLTNVTTIQDQNGMQATVGDTSVSVTGMGIAIGTGALSSTITIDGYLDQYNWVKHNQTALLPKVIPNGSTNELNLNTIFNYIFEGMSGVEIGSVKYFTHKDHTSLESDETKAKNNYVNAGIVFVEIGSSSYVDQFNVNVNIVHKPTRVRGVMAKTTFDMLDFRFKDAGLKIGSIIDINAATVLGTDGRFICWSYKDGRDWVRPSFSIFNPTAVMKINLVSGSKPNVVLDATKTRVPSATRNDFSGTYVPVIYRGYYDDFGGYADYYVVNVDNTISAN